MTQAKKQFLICAKNFVFAALFVVMTLAVFVGNARATLYLSEPFDYPAANLTTALPWSGAGSNLKMIAGNLTNAGLADFAPTNNTKAQGTASAADGKRTFNATAVGGPAVGGSLYVSFLLRQTTLAASSGPLLALADATSVGSGGNGALVVYLNKSGSQFQIGVKKNGSAVQYPASGTYAVNDTVLVVARYKFNTGSTSDDTITLWINPVVNGVEPAPGATGITETNIAGSTDFTNGLQYLHLRANSSTASGVNEVDNVRVGSTWAEVTPVDGVTPPVISNQPRITESFLSSGALVLRGTNGPASSVYQVLSSVTLATPMANWLAIATNLFDTNGNFDSTNPVSPSDLQRFYGLLVGGTIVLPPTNSGPTITVEPGNLTVTVGQNAGFTLTASGSAPLSYRWYFNTNTLLPWATGNSITVTNAQLVNVGTYHAVVTNLYGAATSVLATLSVITPPPAGTPDGYATVNGGTTGGAGGPTVTVNNFADFVAYVGAATPYIVQVSGTINLGGSNVRVRDNKTIVGLGTDAMLIGDLKVFGNNNVIIRNLTMSNPGAGDNDGLTLQECLNVWVDHCTFVDCDDGSLDISHGADWVTVSWCHFYYTNPANTHRFANLVGHSDSSTAEAEDTGKLHVTFHHNWWGQLVHERMPRVRFGRVHVYNNFYNAPGNNNCIRAARDSEILVENNYFDSVKNVWERYVTVGLDGKVFATNNIEVNTTWSAGDDSSSVQIPGTDILSNAANGLNPVPYAYAPDAASLVPNLVTNGAGAGKGPFAP